MAKDIRAWLDYAATEVGRAAHLTSFQAACPRRSRAANIEFSEPINFGRVSILFLKKAHASCSHPHCGYFIFELCLDSNSGGRLIVNVRSGAFAWLLDGAQ
jgi:hypothetical protein